MSGETTVIQQGGARAGGRLRGLIESEQFRRELARVLPKHLSADRMARVAVTALLKTPKLLECDPASVVQCLLDCSSAGLEPDGRVAHLIPYKRTCTLVIDYKGYVQLAMRTGQISFIHADVVREGDVFEFDAGELLHHVPWFLRRGAAKPESAGPVYAAYCRVRFKDGAEKTEVMSLEEIEAIRRRSRAADSGPWVTDWVEMAKKTVFRRCRKWLPQSGELQRAEEAEDKHETIIQSAPAQAAGSGDFSALLPPAAAETARELLEPTAAPAELDRADQAAQQEQPAPKARRKTKRAKSGAEKKTREPAEAPVEPPPPVEPAPEPVQGAASEQMELDALLEDFQ